MANNVPINREDHWSRPVAMDPDGQWISLREVIDEEPARFSFVQLTPEQQSEFGCGNAFDSGPDSTLVSWDWGYSAKSVLLTKSGRERV